MLIFSTFEEKFRISARPCDIPYLSTHGIQIILVHKAEKIHDMEEKELKTSAHCSIVEILNTFLKMRLTFLFSKLQRELCCKAFELYQF